MGRIALKGGHMACFDPTMQEEAMVTQIIHRIARKHGCSVNIDYNTHTITFNGPEDVKLALAQELDQFFVNV